MAKRKDSPVLFEVISKGRQDQRRPETGVPTWMGPSAAGPAQADPAGSPGLSASEPLVSAAGGRLRLSLSYTSCAAAVAGLMLLLAGAAALGRYSATPKTGPGVPREEVVAGTGGVEELPPPPGREGQRKTVVQDNKRVNGKYYLVIQNLLKGLTPQLKAEAEKIEKFCRDNGRPATVNEWQGSYIVWSLEPFDSPEDPAAKKFAQDIEELGKLYSRQGGRYNFMQRRSAGGPLDPMFIAFVQK